MLKKVVIIGAGPAGILLAHYLLRRGKYQIEIFERRSDPRLVEFANVRTFPISLQERGRRAIREIEGLEAAVCDRGIFCRETFLYRKNGKKRLIARKNPIFTIDRNRLVATLLDRLTEKVESSRVTVYFEHQCTEIDANNKTVKLQTKTTNTISVNYDILIGADGSRSVVRNYLAQQGLQCQETYVPDAYKSVLLPRVDPTLNFELEADTIHTWRLTTGSNWGIRLLMVPQPENRLNGVIIFDAEKNPFEKLSTKEEVQAFFRQNFPPLGQLMSLEEAEALNQRPVARVLTVSCARLHHGDSIMILGDAAHAVSPSLGQGCNCSLEDVQVLDRLLDQYQDDWAQVLPEFSNQRIPDLHALRELSNYAFPRSKILTLEFFLRLTIRRWLHKLFYKQFQPFVFDLIFETTLPYSEVLYLSQGWINRVKKSQQFN
ncbi:MAG: NAD(P)/FAD-dependent oxidoreductase [Stanieria sp.]